MTYFGLFLPSEGLEYSAYTLLIWCFLANEYLFCISFKNTKKCIHVWMARGWANNAIIFIFGWTIPLNWIIARIVLHYLFGMYKKMPPFFLPKNLGIFLQMLILLFQGEEHLKHAWASMWNCACLQVWSILNRWRCVCL